MKSKALVSIIVSVFLFFEVKTQLPPSATSGFSVGTSVAAGQYSTAFGDSSVASGLTSIAIGKKAIAAGDYSFALGENSYSGALGSMSVGFGSRAEGLFSLGFGFLNFSPQEAWFATAIGAANEVYAWGGTAIGRDNISYGASASVLGTRSYARTYGETIIGAYAEDYTPNTADPYVWHPEDRVFVVANGWGDGDSENDGDGFRSNALVILKNGNTTLDGNLKVEKRINVGDEPTETPKEGDIRFNSQTKDFEGFTGITWTSLTSQKGESTQSVTIAEKGDWNENLGSQYGFLTFAPSVEGESTISGHENEIEILGLDLSLATPSQIPYGRGTILKKLDKSTITFIEQLHNNIRRKATIEMYNTNGEIPTKRMKYTLEGTRFITYDHKRDADDVFNIDRFQISYNCITVEHFDFRGFSTGAAKTWNFRNNSEVLNPQDCQL